MSNHLPYWFGAWCRWLASGKTTPRPPQVPPRIPKYLFALSKARVARIIARRQTSQIFTTYPRFTLVNNPRGGVETLTEMKDNGFTLAFLNVRDFPVDAWDKYRALAKAAGVAVAPWARIYVPSDLDTLAVTAAAWKASAAGFNVENPEVSVDRTLRPFVLADWYQRSWFQHSGIVPVVITEPWIQNEIEWRGLDALGWECVVEAFWNQYPWAKPSVLVAHARTYFSRVTPMFGAYPVAGRFFDERAYFEDWKDKPYGVYLSDNVGTAWPDWTP